MYRSTRRGHDTWPSVSARVSKSNAHVPLKTGVQRGLGCSLPEVTKWDREQNSRRRKAGLTLLNPIPGLGGFFLSPHIIQIACERCVYGEPLVGSHGLPAQSQSHMADAWRQCAHSPPGCGLQPKATPSPLARLVSTASSTQRPEVASGHSHTTAFLHTSSTEPSWAAPGLCPASPKGSHHQTPEGPFACCHVAQMPPSNLPLLPEARGSQPSWCTHESTNSLVKNAGSGAQAPKGLISQNWGARVCESLVPREHAEKSSFKVPSKGRAGSVLVPRSRQELLPPNLLNGAQWPPLARPQRPSFRGWREVSHHPRCSLDTSPQR